MFKRAENHYGQTPLPETPYQKAGQVWDERLGSARVQAQNWRIAAFCALGLSAVLAAGLIWQGSRSIITPYVVEVSETGVTRAVGPAMETYKPNDAQIAWHLAEFIQNVRSVSIDPVIVRENWLQAYDYATDRGAASLNDFARDNDPFANIGRRSVTVEIISVVRSSSDSFELRWRETSFQNGQKDAVTYFTGSLTIALEAPRTAELLRKNPLGIYVHGLNWSKDHITGDNS